MSDNKGEDYPLNVNDEAQIVVQVIAEEALNLWADGLNFEDMFDNPAFRAKTAGLATPEILDAISDHDYDKKRAEFEKFYKGQVKQLVDQGFDEHEAIRVVRGELLRAFVQIQSEKEYKGE